MVILGAFLRETESHVPASAAQRRWMRAFVNPRRLAVGLPPLEEPDEPPEVELVHTARRRGLLRRRHRPV